MADKVADSDAIYALADQLASKPGEACTCLFRDYVDTDHCSCDEHVHRLIITCCSDKLVKLLKDLDDFGDQSPAYWAMLLLTELTGYHEDVLVRRANIKAVLEVVLRVDDNIVVQELIRMVAFNRRDFADASGYHVVVVLVDQACKKSNFEAMQLLCQLMLFALDIRDESAETYNRQFVKAGIVESVFEMLVVAFDKPDVVRFAGYVLLTLQALGYSIPDEQISKLGAERWAAVIGCQH